MFLQDAPADTLNYMLLGFGVIFVSIAALVGSIIARFRSLQRDLRWLDELESKDSSRESNWNPERVSP
jgi:hypothetical protein